MNFRIFTVIILSLTLIHCAENVGKRGVIDSPRPLVVQKPKDSTKNSDTSSLEERIKKMKERSVDKPTEHPADSYARFARCTGWPAEEGEGTLEFYWNTVVPEDRVIIVRTTGTDTDEVVQSFATMTLVTNEEDKSESLVIEQKSAEGSAGFAFELKKGTRLKTAVLIGSEETVDLLCSTLK